VTITSSHDLADAFGPARHQGQRPTCLAFALSDLNRVFAKAPNYLSPEYLYRSTAAQTPGWIPDKGLDLHCAVNAVGASGQPIELAMPYGPLEPTIPLEALPVFKELYLAKFTVDNLLADGVIAALAQGEPTGLVIKITQDFLNAPGGVIPFSPMVFPDKRHAVIATAVGVHDDTGEQYIRVRNSWGTAWGQAGYAWLHFGYVDAHTVSTFKV
jgi:hypothetical protein